MEAESGLLDRALGAYLGLAIGDALGATVEKALLGYWGPFEEFVIDQTQRRQRANAPDLRLAGALDLALPQTLLSLAELLTRGFQLGEYRQRVPFGQVMKEVEQIGHAQAL